MFKVGQLVYIHDSSDYFYQTDLTDGEAGTIVHSYKTDKTDDNSKIWYSVEWKNLYKNGYQAHDLRHAPEQFASNKDAAKTLLQEGY